MQIRQRHFWLLLVAAPLCSAHEWQLGVAGGYGFPMDVTVTNRSGEAKTGFKPGFAVGAVGSHELYRSVSGEFRYTYRDSDLKVSSGGTEATFRGVAHAIHYDVLVHTRPKGAALRPFFAGGMGIKVYRGTDRESAYQPLNTFVLLTKTQQVVPLVSAGAGLKYAISPHTSLRIEFRDYITPFPKDVIAPAPGAKIGGWVHDLVPMLGISFSF